MALQTNIKGIVFQDITNRFGIGDDAKFISDEIKKHIDSRNVIKNTKIHMVNTDLPLAEQLYNAKAACKIKISEISMYLSNDLRSRFFTQIDNLMDPDNWEEDDEPITTESFTTLLKMLLFIKPERRPGLGAASNGNIIAAWTKDKDRLTIECLPGDKVRWVLSKYTDNARESGAGETQLTRLPTVLAPYHPEHWFADEAKKG